MQLNNGLKAYNFLLKINNCTRIINYHVSFKDIRKLIAAMCLCAIHISHACNYLKNIVELHKCFQ